MHLCRWESGSSLLSRWWKGRAGGELCSSKEKVEIDSFKDLGGLDKYLENLGFQKIE